jgi:Protein of unknown function (DUF5674)
MLCSGVTVFEDYIRSMPIEAGDRTVSLEHLSQLASATFGNLVKAAVDAERWIMTVGGELHADEEAALRGQGSDRYHLWVVNIYPALPKDERVAREASTKTWRPEDGARSLSSSSLRTPEAR